MQIFLFSFFFLSFLLEVGNKDALSRQEFHELPSFLSSRRGKVKLIRSFEQRINSVDDFLLSRERRFLLTICFELIEDKTTMEYIVTKWSG